MKRSDAKSLATLVEALETMEAIRSVIGRWRDGDPSYTTENLLYSIVGSGKLAPDWQSALLDLIDSQCAARIERISSELSFDPEDEPAPAVTEAPVEPAIEPATDAPASVSGGEPCEVEPAAA